MKKQLFPLAVVGLTISGCAFFPSWTSGQEDLRLRSVDGGVDYYQGFDASLPASRDFFPVGVWLESVIEPDEVARDRLMGLNTYVGLTSNSDLSQVVKEGSHAIVGWPSPDAAGFMLVDEVDMWAGPGEAAWTGNYPGEGEICDPVDAGCGFTVQRTLIDSAPADVLRYSNYGKGVTFWSSDAEARRFVNDFQHVVSADNYWFTDPFICGDGEGGAALNNGSELPTEDCRVARNYGWTVDRVRGLVDPPGSKPVWAFVEVGHPFQEERGGSIEGPELRAAVWSSLIHGARGIVYFNHSFGGDCVSQHVLREACGDAIRPWVMSVNSQIEELAPVLNAPFVEGLTAANQHVDVATKLHEGSFFVLAAAAGNGAQSAEIGLTCGEPHTAIVLGENRSVAIEDNVLRDDFDDANAVHLYQLVGGTCGLDGNSPGGDR